MIWLNVLFGVLSALGFVVIIRGIVRASGAIISAMKARRQQREYARRAGDIEFESWFQGLHALQADVAQNESAIEATETQIATLATAVNVQRKQIAQIGTTINLLTSRVRKLETAERAPTPWNEERDLPFAVDGGVDVD